jgi:hypothetical protein
MKMLLMEIQEYSQLLQNMTNMDWGHRSSDRSFLQSPEFNSQYFRKKKRGRKGGRQREGRKEERKEGRKEEKRK